MAALSIAVWEIRQSARRDVRALVEYIDWVLNCADRSIEITNDAIRYIESEGREGEGVSFAVWQFLSGNALATLEEIQPMRPTHPKLAHHVNRLIRAMAKDVQPSPYTTYNGGMLEHFKTYVVIEREHIAQLRPTPLAERTRKLFGQAWSRVRKIRHRTKRTVGAKTPAVVQSARG